MQQPAPCRIKSLVKRAPETAPVARRERFRATTIGGHAPRQLRPDFVTRSVGFLRLSAWLVNRPSRQVRRETHRREPSWASVPPPYPPAGAREPGKTCASRRSPPAGRRFAAHGGGVPGGIRTHGPQIRNLMLYPAELRGRRRHPTRLLGGGQGRPGRRRPAAQPHRRITRHAPAATAAPARPADATHTAATGRRRRRRRAAQPMAPHTAAQVDARAAGPITPMPVGVMLGLGDREVAQRALDLVHRRAIPGRQRRQQPVERDGEWRCRPRPEETSAKPA